MKKILALFLVVWLSVGLAQASDTRDIDTDGNLAVDIADGGTNAKTVTTARTNLGIPQPGTADNQMAQWDSTLNAWRTVSIIEGLINNEAGDGDIDALWSADKTYDMIYGRIINTANIGDWPVAVTTTHLGYLSGATSNIQEQINGLNTNDIDILSSDPVTPVNGDIWYNTTDHSFNIAQAEGKTKFAGTFTANVSYCADRMGAYAFYYGADHTDGETTACLNSTTTSVTTTTGVTIDTSFNTTVGGTKGVVWDGTTNSYLRVPVANTGVTPLSGRVEFTVKTPADVLPVITVPLFEYYNSTQYVNCTIEYSGGSYRIRANHFDGNVVFTNGAYDVTLALDTAYTIIVDWKSDGTNGTIYSKIGTTEVTSSTGVMTTFTEPTAVDFGENLLGGISGPLGVWHFDEIKMGASQR